MINKKVIAITAVIVLAIFFRFWQFSSIPEGLYQDIAMNGADALTSLKTGDYKVFYTNNNGREGLIVWLDALAIKLFGTEPWVLSLFPAIAGVLAVLGLYFLTKELFGMEIALASSFFMAVSFWAVNFSRMGFRAGLMLPFLIWSFYFLFRGFSGKYRTPILCFILSGILFGLGFYTYIPFRFAPILAVLVFGSVILKKGLKKNSVGIITFLTVTFLVALPIGMYFLNNPSDFFGRTSQVSLFSQASPIKSFAINTIKTLGMFNIAGDFNWRHNYPGMPELFFPVGLLFLLGIWLSIKKFAFEHKFMISWMAVFLLPNILTVEGNPHALRAIGAIPPVMIFSGIGLVWVYKKVQKYFDEKINNPELMEHKPRLLRLKKEFFLLLIMFLLLVATYNYNEYFNLWAFKPQTASAFSNDQVQIAKYLNSLPGNMKKYVIWDKNDRATDNGLPVSAQTVYFLTAEKINIKYMKSDELEKMMISSQKPLRAALEIGEGGAVIAPIYFDLNFLRNLNEMFPQSKIKFVDTNAAVLLIP